MVSSADTSAAALIPVQQDAKAVRRAQVIERRARLARRRTRRPIVRTSA